MKKPEPLENQTVTAGVPTPGPTLASDGPGDTSRSVSRPDVPGYAIEGELGRGGMGVVYRARHLSLNRTVALKMILSGGHAGAAELARFRAEVEAVAKLSHPGIVQVYEVGTTDSGGAASLPWCALEFCPGGSFAELLDGQPMLSREAAEVVRQLALAVQHAHAHNIVHRDLKPANILRAEDGTLKITDFGLAKHADGGVELTGTGAMMGTPSYMAPEQWTDARRAGPAADIWALGVIFHETLTGRRPFVASTQHGIMAQVCNDEPAPFERGVPIDLATICRKCLRKEPDQRYASAEALAEDLRRYLDGEPITARAVGRGERAVKWVRRNPLIAGLLTGIATLLLLTTGGAIAAVVQVRAARDAAEIKAQDEHAARTRADTETVRANRQAEEARRQLVRFYIATGARAADEGDLWNALVWYAEAWKRDRDNADAEPAHRLRLAGILARAPRLRQVFFHRGMTLDAVFSPDGKRLLTRTGSRQVSLWDVETGEAVGEPLRHDGRVNHIAFAANGERVTASEDRTARVWDAAGKPLLTLTHDQPVRYLSVHPDGTLLVTASGNQMRFWRLPSGEADGDAIDVGKPITFVTFDRAGQQVLASNNEWARVWDVETRRPTMPGMARPRSAFWEGERDKPYPSFSPDGKLLVQDDGSVLECKGGKSRLKGGSPGYFSAGFNPDGTRIFTAGFDLKVTVREIATGQVVAVLTHPRAVIQAAWSPDGRQIVAASAGGVVTLWDVESQKPIGIPLKHGVSTSRVGFSADGRSVLVADLDGTARLWDFGQSELSPTETSGKIDPEVVFRWIGNASRDGQRRAVQSVDGREVRIEDVRTGKTIGSPLAISESGRFFFSPDGQRLAQTTLAGITFWDLATSRTVGTPFRFRNPIEIRGAAFSPDGQRFAAGGVDSQARILDVNTGRQVSAVGHRGVVQDVMFSPDGAWLATASLDNTARVWEVATGKPVGPALPHRSYVQNVSFSPDGRSLATGDHACLVRLWDARTGDPLLPPLQPRPGTPETGIAPWFGKDGNELFGTTNPRTYRWTLPRFRASIDDLPALVELYTGSFLDATGGTSYVSKTAFTTHLQRYDRAWRAAQGRPLPALPDSPGPVSGVLTASQAGQHLGEVATVEFQVLAIGQARSEARDLCFLNSREDLKDPTMFTGVVNAELLGKLGCGPVEELKGKTVRLTGLVVEYRGRPEITVDDQEQIQILTK